MTALIIQFMELVNGLWDYLKPENQSVMSLKSMTVPKVTRLGGVNKKSLPSHRNLKKRLEIS
jgi:hypothetical protein